MPGYCRTGSLQHGERAREHHDDRDDPREDGAIDEETRQHGRATSVSAPRRLRPFAVAGLRSAAASAPAPHDFTRRTRRHLLQAIDDHRDHPRRGPLRDQPLAGDGRDPR